MQSMFLSLSLELQLHILGYLPPLQLISSISRVSRHLNIVAADNGLWRKYFKKEYQSSESLKEKFNLHSFKKAFIANHPELICEEYLYLHPLMRALMKMYHETSDEQLKAEQLKEKALQSIAYATYILSNPLLLKTMLQYFADVTWLGEITRLFPKTALYPLKQYQMLQESLPIRINRSLLIMELAALSLEPALYFLNSPSLIKIALEEPVMSKIYIKKIVKISPETAQHFLDNPELTAHFLGSTSYDESELQQIEQLAHQAVGAQQNTYIHQGP